MPKIKKAILHELVYFTKKYQTAYPSQELISKKAGCSREYVNKTISEFQSAGILLKRNLPWRSCLYVLHPYLYSIEFRKRCDLLLLADKKFDKKKFTPISHSSSLYLYNNPNPNQYPSVLNQKDTDITITFDSNVPNSKKEKMTDLQTQIANEFKLDFQNRNEISGFSESVLKKSSEITRLIKNLSKPAAYFMKVARTEQKKFVMNPDRYDSKEVSDSVTEVKVKTRELEEDEYTTETLREIERKIRTFQSAINQCTDTRLKQAYTLSLEDYKKKVVAIQEVLAGTELKSENEIQAEKYEHAANHIRTNYASSVADLKHAGELEQKALDLRNALPKEVEPSSPKGYAGQRKRAASSLKNIYTPQEMANEISIFMDEEHLKHAAKLMGLTEAIKFRDTCLRNLLRRRIGEPIDGNDHIAMTVINKHRDRLAISPKFKPRSPILNENTANNINTHCEQNHSPNANVVDILNAYLNTPIKAREQDLSNNQHSFVTGHILTKQSNFEYYSDQYEEMLD